MVNKVSITKFARIVSVMFLRKIEKPMLMFEVFSFFFFFLFFCVHFLCSLVILTIIRTRKWQRTHFNNASNYNYDIMAKSRYNDILNFPNII